MKCALHLHTNLSDGALSPQEMVQAYADLGFGCVCLTDHEFLLRDHYARAIAALDPCGMVVLAGVEVDYEPWHYHHLLRILGEKETLHVLAHPSAYFLSVAEVNARLVTAPFPIEAVEVSYRGFYTPAYDTPEVTAVKVASDDAHEPNDCGRAWIELPESRRPDAILRAIKAGDCRVRFFRNSW